MVQDLAFWVREQFRVSNTRRLIPVNSWTMLIQTRMQVKLSNSQISSSRCIICCNSKILSFIQQTEALQLKLVRCRFLAAINTVNSQQTTLKVVSRRISSMQAQPSLKMLEGASINSITHLLHNRSKISWIFNKWKFDHTTHNLTTTRNTQTTSTVFLQVRVSIRHQVVVLTARICK